MSIAYEIKTFSPRAENPLFSDVVQQLYSGNELRLQQAGDAVNHQYAAAGIAVLHHGKPAGRLVLYASTKMEIQGKKVLVAGNYECIDDQTASLKLLHAAAEMARMERYGALIGPMNGTTWDTYRFCTNPEAGNFFSEMVHKAWYPKQWQLAGFEVLADYVSMIDKSINHDSAAVLRAEKSFLDKGVKFRTLDIANYEQELQKLFSLCEKAFAANLLYTPVTWETFRDKYMAVKSYIVPEMVFIAEDAAGKIIAFAFNFPDHLNPDLKRIILKTLARDPDKAYRGLGDVLGNMSQRYAKTHGFNAIIHALMFAGNFSLKLSKKYRGEAFKNYQLYIQHL
jgi:hypothetical protein